MPTKNPPSPKSNSSSDDETEFVPLDDIPIVKPVANLKGRLAGLAKGRAKQVAEKTAVRKVKEVTQTINKAQRLQEKATSVLNAGREKAKEVGLAVPEASPFENQLQQMLSDMRNEIKELKSVKETQQIEELTTLPEPEKPKQRAIRKKPAPKPKKAPEPEPENEFVSPVVPSPLDPYRGRGPQPYHSKQAEYAARLEEREHRENLQMDLLRRMMGRN